jgi:hypothetical protein
MAKLQWYTMFIKRKVLRPSTATLPRELDILHKFIETVGRPSHYITCCTTVDLIVILPQFESPLWAGTLPPRIGEPAGGSLSADAYKMATTGPLAIIVSILIFYHNLL